jgi:hypothetical protein
MAAPLALIFGEILLGGILIDHGVKDVKGALGSGSGTVTPSSSLGTGTYSLKQLTGDQQTFGATLAKLSGLSPTFVDAWLLHEQPAGQPSAPGSNNWLNVGYTDSGPDSTYYQIAGLSPAAAAAATWQWLQTNQPSIAAAAGKSLSAQVAALENSGWASSHYGNESASQFLSAA